MINTILIINYLALISNKLISSLLIILFFYLLKNNDRKIVKTDFLKDPIFLTSSILILWMIINSSFISVDSGKSFSTLIKIITFSIIGFLSCKFSVKDNDQINYKKTTFYLILFNAIIIYEHCNNYPIIVFLKNLFHIESALKEPLDAVNALFSLFVPYLYIKLARLNILFILLLIVTIVNYMIHPMSAIPLTLITGLLLFLLARFVGDIIIKIYFIIISLILCSAPWLMNIILKSYEFNKIILEIPDSWIHRVIIWKKVIKLIHTNYLLGYGINSSLTLDNFIPLHPHNGFLQIWLDLGLIGVIATLILFHYIYKRIITSKDKLARFLAFNIFLVFFTVSFGLWQSWWIASIWIAIIFYSRKENINH